VSKTALKSYRELEVWRCAMDVVEEVYRFSKEFPTDEKFGLTSQIRRAAVSVPANIAEGYGRVHRGDYIRHLSVANGSLMELETHLLIAGRLEYLKKEKVKKAWGLIQQTSKMLSTLIKSL
jgi:four helix bundle protein